MRRTISIIIMVFGVTMAARAQSLMPSISTDPVWLGVETDSANAVAWGDYSMQSSALQQSFLNKFVFGGYIDEELKDRVNNNLKNRNHLFYNSQAGGGFFSRIKNNNGRHSRWYVLLRNQQFTHLEFPPQLFQLAFYGNGSAKTDQGAFTDAYGNYISGNRVDIGWHRHWYAENGRRWGISANIGAMQVNSQWELDWPEGQLTTEPGGTAISFDNVADFRISDTSQNGLFSMEGWGAAGDLQISATNGSMDWFFTVKDLGQTWMNESSLQISLDTAYTYRGSDIKKLISSESSLFPSGDQDSLLNVIGARASKGSFSGSLPALISIAGQRHIGNWDVMGGINYRLGVYRMPLFFATVGYENEAVGMNYGATLAYGGEGMFRFGLQLQKSFNEKLKLHIGMNNLNALILPSTFSGFSAFGAVRYNL